MDFYCSHIMCRTVENFIFELPMVVLRIQGDRNDQGKCKKWA